MAEPYVADLFVGRTAPLAQIIDLANDSDPAQRVLSVVGPPGVGKSYLLNYARDRLRRSGRLVFWVNLSRDPQIRSDCPDVTVPARFRDWLRQSIALASQRCDQVRAYDSAASVEAVVQTLVSVLCGQCDPKPNPMLIVDGFEEISVAERDALEKSLLEPFISGHCTRIIIGRRDEFSLNSSALRWTEDRLDLTVFNSTEAQQQVSTRLTRWNLRPHRTSHTGTFSFPANLPLTLGLPNLIPPYQWNHPGINNFLLECIMVRYQAGSGSYLFAGDLADCLREVTRIPTHLSKTEIDFLIKIGNQLPELWTSDNLMINLQIAFEDPLLEALFDRGIVISVPNTPTYQVADGIRELVQALYHCNISATNPQED
jgi:hypothetical protein